MYNPSHNPKWREAGRKLGIKRYQNTPPSELEEKKKTAEAWLLKNQNHPNYEEGVKRYEAICDELNEFKERVEGVEEHIIKR